MKDPLKILFLQDFPRIHAYKVPFCFLLGRELKCIFYRYDSKIRREKFILKNKIDMIFTHKYFKPIKK